MLGCWYQGDSLVNGGGLLLGCVADGQPRAWAKPLANELVSVFRVDSLSYVRVAPGTYDPLLAPSPTPRPPSPAGAITERRREEVQNGLERYEIDVWMALSDIGEVYPTYADYFTYDGTSYKIMQIDPIYSGDTKYAVKCRARAN